MAYESLNNSEVNNASRVCGGRILAAGAARLYLASGKSWQHYSTGAAVLVDDAAAGGKFIRMVDLSNSNVVTFDQELYEHFDYSASRPFFHVFETADTVAALSFASEKDAAGFLEMINKAEKTSVTRSPPPVPNKALPSEPAHAKPPLPDHKPPPVPGGIPPIPNKKPPPPPPGVPPAEPQPPPQPQPPVAAHAQTTTAPATAPPPAEKKPSTPQLTQQNSSNKINKPAGGGGFLSSLFGGSKEPELVISDPRNFRHESHVGWDPQNGFEIRNIPPDWKKLFSDAGIKKSELKNPETSKFILETVAVAVMNKEAPSGPPTQPGAAPPSPTPHHHAPSTPLPKPPPPKRDAPAEATPTPGGPSSPRPAEAKPTSPRPAPPPPPHAPSHGAPPPPPPPAAHPGPPPPPPPHGGPAPPPPPPAHSSTPGGPPPPPAAPKGPIASDSRGDLLAQIKQGKQLKKADLPELSTMKTEDKNSLVSTLASAMQARRAAIGTEEAGDDDDSNWDD